MNLVRNNAIYVFAMKASHCTVMLTACLIVSFATSALAQSSIGELDVSAQGSTAYYFPHLAVGASWQTTITYSNYSPEEVSCQTDFLSDHGGPLMVSFAELGTVVSRTDVLPPRGSVHPQ